MTGALPVSEVYGPVWQGEGPHAGRVCWFVRLGHCNLHCAWCDTPYTWDRDRCDVDAECPPRTVEWVTQQLPHSGLVILTGGEPLIHQHRFPELVNTAGGAGQDHTWHIETNGTITPNADTRAIIDFFVVSPKVNPQGDPERRRIKPHALEWFVELANRGRAAFKVVCSTSDDVDRAAQFYDTHAVPSDSRWVMPEGVTAEAVLDTARLIEPTALQYGLNLTLRTHTLMHGTERRR